MYFSGFLYERLIFYELFCEGPSDLCIYALTTVRGLRTPIHNNFSVEPQCLALIRGGDIQIEALRGSAYHNCCIQSEVCNTYAVSILICVYYTCTLIMDITKKMRILLTML